MKVYVAIKYHSDLRNRTRIEQAASALEGNGFETVCVVRDLEKWGRVRFSPQELMTRTFAAIDSCQLVVVELTEKGVGLGIEAGYPHARHIPIVTIAEAGADISSTLRGISSRVLYYGDGNELRRLIAVQIAPELNRMARGTKR